MFYALTMLLQGPLWLLLKKVERAKGLEAWRLLVERYEGATSSRLHQMLQSVMRPRAFPQASGGFEVALNEWEHLVQRWEVLANDNLSDTVKRQILLDMAPSGIRVHLTLVGHSNYEALRSAVISYFVASRDWNATVGTSDSTPAPMEVDALTPPRRNAKKTRARGRRVLASRRRSQQAMRPARPATYAC